MKRILTLVILTVGSFSSYAGKTYTPNELTQMIRNGQYPDQGFPQTQSTDLPFSSCKAKIEDMLAQLRGTYPFEVVMDNSVSYMIKAWTNDAAVVVTCSKADDKMAVTRSFYK